MNALTQASIGSIHARIMNELPDSPERTKLLRNATLAIVGQGKAALDQLAPALPQNEYVPAGDPAFSVPQPGSKYAPATLEGQLESGLY